MISLKQNMTVIADPQAEDRYYVRMGCTNCLHWFEVSFQVGTPVRGELVCPICGCNTLSDREKAK